MYVLNLPRTPNYRKKVQFSKIRLCQFLLLLARYLHAKSQQNPLYSFLEKHATDIRVVECVLYVLYYFPLLGKDARFKIGMEN